MELYTYESPLYMRLRLATNNRATSDSEIRWREKRKQREGAIWRQSWQTQTDSLTFLAPVYFIGGRCPPPSLPLFTLDWRHSSGRSHTSNHFVGDSPMPTNQFHPLNITRIYSRFHNLRTGLKMKSVDGITAAYRRLCTVWSRRLGAPTSRTLLSPRTTVRNTVCDII